MFLVTMWTDKHVIDRTVDLMIDAQVIPELGFGCKNAITDGTHLKQLMTVNMNFECCQG